MVTVLSSSKVPADKNGFFFSVITPMYNREATIGRCLDSCLSQGFDDYEVVIVDDGSEDNSVRVVESYLPNRHITLIRSSENIGVSAARGLGVLHSKGKWLMFMDSDDAFHSGAFQTIYESVRTVSAEVGEVRFRYWREDSKCLCPIPMMPEGVLDFADYLRWVEVAEIPDALNCQRREVYDVFTWPTDRQYESGFLMQIYSKFKIIMSGEVVGTVYDDAPNRITKENKNPLDPKFMITARDNANAQAKAIEQFGIQLKEYCPRRYQLIVRSIGNLYMMCGEKLKGARYLLKYLTMQPWSLVGWSILILGLLGPRVLSWGKNMVQKAIGPSKFLRAVLLKS